MAILKIVPDKDYQVLMEYLSDSDVVLLPESVLAGFSPEIQRKFHRMDQEGQVDYDFGGDPDVYVDVIRSDCCYAYGKPIPAYKRGYTLFSACHLPEKSII